MWMATLREGRYLISGRVFTCERLCRRPSASGARAGVVPVGTGAGARTAASQERSPRE